MGNCNCRTAQKAAVRVWRRQVVKFDPWDMLNKFCFHVYAQKSLFIAENVNVFFGTSLSCEFGVSRAGSQLKIIYFLIGKQIFEVGNK